MVSLRCSGSLARGEPFAPLCGGCPGRVYSCMSVHAGGVFRHRTWLGCCVEGVTLASPTGSWVDLRAVAGVRQKGECCGSAMTTTMISFVRGLLLRFVLCLSAQSLSPCIPGALCPRHEMYPSMVLSFCKCFRTTLLPVAHASFVGRPLSDGFRLACSCMPVACHRWKSRFGGWP